MILASQRTSRTAPEEFAEVQKEGELNAFIYSPKDVRGPTPFVILLHGCGGLGTEAKEWAAHVATLLNKEGVGVLALDSFTTRYVDRTCGPADLHWGRRRADDAYSALDYLIEKKLANEVYLMGYSNGGTTTLVSMTTQEADHPHHFAAAFAVPQVAALRYSIPHYIPVRLSSLWGTTTTQTVPNGAKNWRRRSGLFRCR